MTKGVIALAQKNSPSVSRSVREISRVTPCIVLRELAIRSITRTRQNVTNPKSAFKAARVPAARTRVRKRRQIITQIVNSSRAISEYGIRIYGVESSGNILSVVVQFQILFLSFPR